MRLSTSIITSGHISDATARILPACLKGSGLSPNCELRPVESKSIAYVTIKHIIHNCPPSSRLEGPAVRISNLFGSSKVATFAAIPQPGPCASPCHQISNSTRKLGLGYISVTAGLLQVRFSSSILHVITPPSIATGFTVRRSRKRRTCRRNWPNRRAG